MPAPSDDSATNNIKRTEKFLKKAKLFFDEKQKAKIRLASLFSFIESIAQFPAQNATAQGIPSTSATSNGPSLSSPNTSTMENSVDAFADQQFLAKFFQDNYAMIFYVLNENFIHFLDKSRGKEKSDKSITASKEFADLLRIVGVFRKLVLFVPEKIESVKIIQLLLYLGNHSKLRVEGFKLLLVWINAQSISLANSLISGTNFQNHDAVKTYCSAIDLSMFEAFPIPFPSDAARSNCMDLDSIPWESKDERNLNLQRQRISKPEFVESDATPVNLNSNYPTESDSIELMEEIMANISALSSLACAQVLSTSGATTPKSVHSNHSADMIWKSIVKISFVDDGIANRLVTNRLAFCALVVQWYLLKQFILNILFPAVSSKFQNAPTEGDFIAICFFRIICEIVGFSECPVDMLKLLLSFIARQTAPDPSGHNFDLSSVTTMHVYGDFPQKSCKLLQHIITDGVESRELIHEIIRQGLIVPWAHSDLGRYSIYILRSWVFSLVSEGEPSSHKRNLA
ncbi:hypothetical protein HDU84_000522 [Entophlyctis sp. JEL0112]|nr:hypothetical protein HDU84_000522 [Entophlyctis sp. JEL0112]